ncbi:MAG: hypothetical protein GF398_14750 [Chitinivibrionales bacterium]|nr:hypothetical protein [Chitinivibrionales bacterium]
MCCGEYLRIDARGVLPAIADRSDSMNIKLAFENFTLTATVFDTRIGRSFYEILPCTINLSGWGNELYGSIGIDFGSDSPVAEIPAGGLAYSSPGNYLCIFYGQRPAWPVEHIGEIVDDWQRLESVNSAGVSVSALDRAA